MIEASDTVQSSVTFLPGTTNGAASGVHAREVLAELERRYEPAPWRRYGAVIAALALVVIAIAGTSAVLASRRRAG